MVRHDEIETKVGKEAKRRNRDEKNLIGEIKIIDVLSAPSFRN